jgi:uncharacterized protein RhaS with RHS repeats
LCFTGKEQDDETGLYYYGARYLDPKYSRWLSPDPALKDYIPGAPINDEVKKKNGELPGMGGVFNTVNLHLYHYAGNNPVMYVDPDGKQVAEAVQQLQGVNGNPYLVIGAVVLSGILILGSLLYDAFKSNSLNINQSEENNVDNQTAPEDTANSDTQKDPVDDIIEDATEGRETKGRTKQYEKPGNMDDANKDFDKLKPQNVREFDKGRVGELPDGRKVNVRDQSSDGRPTLEVQDGKNKIKIRYGE